jgi:hypothetical protein
MTCRLAKLGSQTMLQMMLVDNLIHSGAHAPFLELCIDTSAVVYWVEHAPCWL